MKLHVFAPFCALICANVFAAQPTATPGTPAPAASSAGSSNLVDKGSYALGVTLGNNMRMQDAQPNVDQVMQGFRDGLSGKAKLSETEVREQLAAWQRDVRTQKMEKNKKAGEEFIAKKASEPGVKKLSSGVLYKVINTGKGPQPKAGDNISAHYKGTLIDGTEFDSSYTRGQPFTTVTSRVIPGWQDALTNMHVGDKWELYVPSHLAYGERGQGGKIGPNAALIFEMELLSILPPAATPTNAMPTISLPPNARPGAPAPAQPQIRVQPGQPATPASKPAK